MADLPDYTRGFLDGIKLARRVIGEFHREHPLLFPVTDEIGRRIADAEMEETMRLHHEAVEARRGEHG